MSTPPSSRVPLIRGHSDSAAKQILLHLDAQREGPSKFIVREGMSPLHSPKLRSCVFHRRKIYAHTIEVDDTHVMVKRDHVDDIKDLLQEEVCPHPSSSCYLVDGCVGRLTAASSSRRTLIFKIPTSNHMTVLEYSIKPKPNHCIHYKHHSLPNLPGISTLLVLVLLFSRLRSADNWLVALAYSVSLA